MTHVITAPHIDDPRDNGFVNTLPGELVIPYSGFPCASGDTCGCNRAWIGVATRVGTTLAAVGNQPISRADYVNLLAPALTTGGRSEDGATSTAEWLAGIAAELALGTLLTIDLDDHEYQVNILMAGSL